MITEFDAVALMREANPVPDLASYDAADPDVAAYLADLRQGSSNVTQQDIKQEPEKTTTQPPRMWMVAAAVVVVAASVGVFLSRSGNEVAGPPGAADLIGTWDYVLDEELAHTWVVNNGFIDDIQEVAVRIGFFDDQAWWQGFVYDGELDMNVDVPEGGPIGQFEIDGDLLILTELQGEFRSTFRWELVGDELTLTWVEECWPTSTGDDCTTDRERLAEEDPMALPLIENTFTKSSDDPNY